MVPLEGMWRTSWSVVSGDCSRLVTESRVYSLEIIDGSIVVGGTGVYGRVEPGLYVMPSDAGDTTHHVVSPTYIEAEFVGAGNYLGCVLAGKLVYEAESQ